MAKDQHLDKEKAARKTGGLLYERAGFKLAPPAPGQQRQGPPVLYPNFAFKFASSASRNSSVYK